jgi:protein involved in polysaccharide export with SLBB domain
MIRVRFWILSSLMGFLVACGCKTHPAESFKPHVGAASAITNLTSVQGTNKIPAAWLRPPQEPFRLGPGDKIEIEMLGDLQSRNLSFVGPDGKIYYSLLPGLSVWGKTIAETREMLERELARYYRQPKVIVTLRTVDSRRAWILGRLNTPGIYSLSSPMTIIEAIARAGGLFTSRFSGTTEELADLQHSFMVRRGEFLPIDFYRLVKGGDLSQNIYLEADDFVYLPSALSKEIYILGAVKEPKAVGFADQVTLVTALSSAKGPVTGAYLTHTAIVRGSLSQPKIAIVNLRDIILGRSPDILLEPRDIVYVPVTPYQTLEKYADMIVNSFVRVVAANEGSHAAVRSSSPIAPTISTGQ